jgi:hypothetical protein
MLRKEFTITLLFLPILAVFAQPRRNSGVLDDSTQQVYGFKTTRYVLEKDLLLSRSQTYTPDTLIHNFQQYNFLSRPDDRFVDLGNLGSAMRPVFYQPPATTGTRPGVEVFEPYAFTPDQVRYYDTRSPYTHLYYVQGGRGQQILQPTVSRNVNKRWNLGIVWQNFSAPFQFGSGATQAQQGTFANRQTIHNSVVAMTRFFSKDSTYQLLGHFSHLNHLYKEQGGIYVNPAGVTTDGRPIPGDQVPDDLFNYKEESAQINNSEAQDFRNNWHIFQQFVPAQGFQVYHIFDRRKQRNSFSAFQIKNTLDSSFFRNTARNFQVNLGIRIPLPDTTRHQTVYELFENQVGLKGRFGKFDYRIFIRNRSFRQDFTRYGYRLQGSENFAGIVLDYQFTNRADLHAEAEYQIPGNYRLEGKYRNRLGELEFRQMLYAPTLAQRFMANDFFVWANSGSLSSTFYTEAKGKLFFKLNRLEVQPVASIVNLSNYIYFDTLALPRQSGLPTQIFTAGATFRYRLGNWHTENEAVFTQITGADVIRIPQIFANLRVFYANDLFKNNLGFEGGVQVHFKSDYFADAYMPVTAQFYLQDKFRVQGYPVTDLFINLRIKTVRAFFKLAHANQGLTGAGYFPTPYFTALQRTFAFGISWQFFD